MQQVPVALKKPPSIHGFSTGISVFHFRLRLAPTQAHCKLLSRVLRNLCVANC